MGEENTRAVILAGTDRGDWPAGITRHNVAIQGEPLIHRTQRLLLEGGVQDVRVVCPEMYADMYVTTGTHELPGESDRDWVQEWDPSRHLWNPVGRTILIYGDCYLSSKLMTELVNDSGDPWHVYGRWSGSKRNRKAYGELFAWCFTDAAHGDLDRARERAIELVEDGRTTRCLGWEVYRAALGMPLYEHWLDAVHARDFNDASEDFDSPEDHAGWAAGNRRLA